MFQMGAFSRRCLIGGKHLIEEIRYIQSVTTQHFQMQYYQVYHFFLQHQDTWPTMFLHFLSSGNLKHTQIVIRNAVILDRILTF